MAKFPDPELALLEETKLKEPVAKPKVKRIDTKPIEIAPPVVEAPVDLFDQMDTKYADAKVEFLLAQKTMKATEKAFEESSITAADVHESTKQWLKAKRKFAALQQLYGS